MVGDSASRPELVHPRQELVAWLLAFLKEYHLKKQDSMVRDMLRDIQSGSTNQRPLGKWGLILHNEVGDAVAAFEVWKSQGRLFRPGIYWSETHGQDLECIVESQTADGKELNLELVRADSESRKRPGADPSRVRCDPKKEGWFVPSLARVSAGLGLDAATPTPTPTPTPSGARTPPVAVADSGSSEAAAPKVPQAVIKVLQYAFEGKSYGPDYLTLKEGDKVEWIRDDEAGWSEGRLISQPDAPENPVGWYPGQFATPL